MTSFLSGTPEQRYATMQADRQYMVQMFTPWYEKALRWKLMLLPEIPVDKQASSYSSVNTARLAKAITGSDNPYKAHTRTSFIHTGSTAIINRMIRSEIVIETNMNARNEAELEKADLFEDYMQGIISTLNYEFARAGEGTSFVRSRFESLVNHGKSITFAQMKNVKGRAVPFVEGYDPLGCYHTFRGDVRRFGRDVPKSPEEVERIVEDLRSMYGNSIEMPTSIIEAQKQKSGLLVSDYWLEEKDDDDGFNVWRGMSVNGSPVYLGESNALRMPIIITSVNSVSSQYRQVQALGETANQQGQYGANNIYSVDFIENHAEPWYAAGENTIGELDTLTSLILEATHLMTIPPVEIRDESGTVTGFAVGSKLHTAGATIFTTQGQAIRALELVKSSAAEARELMQYFEKELGYLLPPQVRGQPPFAGSSGYLQNQLTDAQKNALVDVFAGGSIHLKAVLQELAQQFYDDGKMKIRLNARVRDGLNVGAHYPRDFAKSDFPEMWDFTVLIDPMTGENDAARLSIATNGLVAGIWDDLRAMQVAGERHPLQMKRRIQAMKAEAHPIFEMIRLEERLLSDITELSTRVDRARSENREDEADAMEITLVRLQAKLKMVQAQGQPPAQGNPALPPGFSPDVVPPQEGPNNPQEAAAAQGKTSVGMGGQGGTAQ